MYKQVLIDLQHCVTADTEDNCSLLMPPYVFAHVDKQGKIKMTSSKR